MCLCGYIYKPVMEWADIKQVCQMELLGFTERQSSQDFFLTSLFILAKGRNYTPDSKQN